jgi:hypothetical protein
LSRGKAEELIVKKMNLPVIQTVSLDKQFRKDISFPEPWKNADCITDPEVIASRDKYLPMKQRLDELQGKGVIIVSESIDHRDNCDIKWAKITLTDEGKKYLVQDSGDAYHLKAYERTFGEVTGIQINEQSKEAVADYTIRVANITPFVDNLPVNPTTHSAQFTLYDDGWRIQ